MIVLKPEDTKIKNATTLLHLLLKQGCLSRAELSRTKGLTKITITFIINKFIALGIVEEPSTIFTDNVGKTPINLYIRTDAV